MFRLNYKSKDTTQEEEEDEKEEVPDYLVSAASAANENKMERLSDIMWKCVYLTLSNFFFSKEEAKVEAKERDAELA